MNFSELSPIAWIVIAAVVAVFAVVAFILGISFRKKTAEKAISGAENEAKRIVNDSIKTAESKKREMLIEAKEEIHKSRTEFDREMKDRRAELQKQERRVVQREESLDKKHEAVEQKDAALTKKIKDNDALNEELKLIKRSQLEM
ncbi:MAG: DUF3552 domain-containing protein, partial [Oscillospiraceae bacterium]|nr:DUF3552 domain-containing protein [Oscillospiraceae bacterium]